MEQRATKSLEGHRGARSRSIGSCSAIWLTALFTIGIAGNVSGGSASPGEPVVETILAEDFEAGLPGGAWLAFDGNGSTLGETFWASSSQRSDTGTRSIWCAGGGATSRPQGGPYANNMDSWIRFGPFNLSDAAAGSLSFRYWNRSEEGFDYFSYRTSIDGVSFFGERVTGDSGGWRSAVLDFESVPVLGDITGEENVWIAFSFTSDFIGSDEGAYVDNVRIEKSVALAEGAKVGTGIGVSGSPHLHVDSYYDEGGSLGSEGRYVLYDTTRRMGSDSHGHAGQMAASAAIETWEQETTGLGFVRSTDSDNVWDEASQAAAVDAHVHAALVHDYLLRVLGLNSFDGMGSSMVSRVGRTPCQDQALWTGTSVDYCQSRFALPFSGALDVAAHEWGHAVTDKLTNLLVNPIFVFS